MADPAGLLAGVCPPLDYLVSRHLSHLGSREVLASLRLCHRLGHVPQLTIKALQTAFSGPAGCVRRHTECLSLP